MGVYKYQVIKYQVIYKKRLNYVVGIQKIPLIDSLYSMAIQRYIGIYLTPSISKNATNSNKRLFQQTMWCHGLANQVIALRGVGRILWKSFKSCKTSDTLLNGNFLILIEVEGDTDDIVKTYKRRHTTTFCCWYSLRLPLLLLMEEMASHEALQLW